MLTPIFILKISVTSLFELNEQQKRQLIDAEVLLSALEQAEEEVIRYRGVMYWREQGGGPYLVSLSAHLRQRSLGSTSPETKSTYQKFTQRKPEVKARLKSLRSTVDEVKRMNKALVGRALNILIDALNAMMRDEALWCSGAFFGGAHPRLVCLWGCRWRAPAKRCDVMATQDAHCYLIPASALLLWR